MKKRNSIAPGSFPWFLLIASAGLSVLIPGAQAQVAAPRPTAAPRRTQNVPAEFQNGIAAMISAKSSLEKAGDKWGGHRVKAIHLIDEALSACGQSRTATPGEMQSGSTDEPSELDNGIAQLNTAKSDFEQAGSEWGGRKAKAVSLIDQALNELQVGIEYAKSHGTY